MTNPVYDPMKGPMADFYQYVGVPVGNIAHEMSQWGRNTADGATQAWLDFKRDNPTAALGLSMVPVTGQITAAADLYDAQRRGDGVDAALAAAQFVPFGGVVKGVKTAAALSGPAAKVAAIKAAGAASVQAGNIIDYMKGLP